MQSKFCTLAGKTEGRSPDGILLRVLLSFYYKFFATSNPFVFLDNKSRYEIPAPLRGLVFGHFIPENFGCTSLCSVALRMTYSMFI